MKVTLANSLVMAAALSAGVVTTSAQTPDACTPPPIAAFQSFSELEVRTLVADVGATNPAVIQRLKDDPELRQNQLSALRDLLALASQSIREGQAARPVDCVELESIRSEVIAVGYDKEKTKGRSGLPPFGLITEDRISAFWGKDAAKATPASVVKARHARFDRFLEAKLALLQEGSPEMAERILSDDERKAAEDHFARIEIYADEYRKSRVLPISVRKKIDLQVKLQQAQFLARQYGSFVVDRTSVSDAEIQAYISARPELDPAAKRIRAEGILKRAAAGEDFAKLADEFSEDPGNVSGSGKKYGGLYADVKAGQMIEAFEKAALSLEPGKVHANLTATDYGFHVIKLEKKSDDGSTYDVRHILISTDLSDPDDPNGKRTTLNAYVRRTLEDEKTQKVMSELIASNGITVPADFSVTVAAVKSVAKKPAAKRPVRKRN